jgi:NAD(P)H-nitrite reductase large subunit
LLAGTRAAGILRRARLVFAEDGIPQPYEKLIIATGSRPFLPQMEGLTTPDGKFKPGVFVFWNALVFRSDDYLSTSVP